VIEPLHHASRLALVTAAAVAIAACAGDETGSEREPTTSSSVESVSNDWALDYTHGTPSAADQSLPPVEIGYINQEGGVPAYPEATAGLEAAVAYVNAELGGAQGHRIEVAKCVVQAEEDGQRCATEMANNADVDFVITGNLVFGNQAIYSVLEGVKPIIIGNPVVVEDLTASDAYAFTPGGVGVVRGIVRFVASDFPDTQSVSVVHLDNPASRTAAEGFLKPLLEAEGITDVTLVAVSDTATGPELAAAVRAAEAEQADLFIPLATVPGCIATYDALQTLGIEPTVITTGLCYGLPMTRHLEDVGSDEQVPDGWYFGDYGYSYFQPDDASGMTTYLAKVVQYGPPDVEFTGFAGPSFANLLTAVRLINEIGVDDLTAESMRRAISTFEGPMMLVAGPMNCGFDPTFLALCGSQVGIQQYEDGEWLSVANALNGRVIDTAS
jgi:branched-chain amino acid transport system substrate-binding protein